MMLGARQFFLKDSKLRRIDGIMISGRYFSTGISASDASHSIEIEADVIVFNLATNGEFDFIGNFDGSVSRALMLGLNGTTTYVYLAGSNRASALGALPLGVAVKYRVSVDYDSGAYQIVLNESSVSGTTSVGEFKNGTYAFYIGSGNGNGYSACPAVIKEVKFSLDNVVAADYVPSYEGGRIGLRDTIRNTFNAATNGFALPYISSIQ